MQSVQRVSTGDLSAFRPEGQKRHSVAGVVQSGETLLLAA